MRYYEMIIVKEDVEYNAKQKYKSISILLFLIGLFSQTQISIGGKLGISELVMVICSPYIFSKNIPTLHRDGVLNFFLLIMLWLAGAIFVDVYTQNDLPFTMRGIAVPITVFANSICIYALLRKNFDNLKWLLLGIAFSGVISIFIFQRGSAGNVAAEYGWKAGMERVVGYKLFWVFQLMTWLTLPVSGWYEKVPKWYSFCALFFLSLFNLASGGRSAFLIASISWLLIIFAGKTRQSLEFIKQHTVIILVFICLMCVIAKLTYKYAVTNGYMGIEEKAKYDRNTKRGSSAFALLFDSRSEFFIGLFAALDKPIIGHGSVAMDKKGYIPIFIDKYGSVEAYKRIIEKNSEFGDSQIPAHSHRIAYGLWHGIWGLIFCIYLIILAGKTIFFRIHVYPPWFGYFAVTIPAFFWDVLFSPFGARVQETTLFVCLLLIDKVYNEKI
jgi:hypothetical protein